MNKEDVTRRSCCASSVFSNIFLCLVSRRRVGNVEHSAGAVRGQSTAHPGESFLFVPLEDGFAFDNVQRLRCVRCVPNDFCLPGVVVVHHLPLGRFLLFPLADVQPHGALFRLSAPPVHVNREQQTQQPRDSRSRVELQIAIRQWEGRTQRAVPHKRTAGEVLALGRGGRPRRRWALVRQRRLGHVAGHVPGHPAFAAAVRARSVRRNGPAGILHQDQTRALAPRGDRIHVASVELCPKFALKELGERRNGHRGV
mmetsp:Transcript_19367/g.48467  ORF Transcript_19367/g.48467 Transcript_19367/m.48467 type:complete len:255 (-) Transcript_19367:3339-4103(-)